MADSCCICGVVLATQDSDFPPWCKDIRAICRFERQHVLSGQGSIDDDAIPFNLPIPLHGFIRFCCRRAPDTAGDFCYPFHTTCWALLQGNSDGEILDDNIETLFNVFESLHYDKISRSLRWGHNYYFEDILDEDRQACQEDIIASHEAIPATLADPSQFDFQKEEVRKRLQKRYSSSPTPLLSTDKEARPDQLSLLPLEIFSSILCYLCFQDARHVIIASRALCGRFGGSTSNLPSSFWESMFWTRGETSFARSLRPPECSWKDWFFTIKSEAKSGPNRMGLQNLKRIWKLGADLIAIVRTIEEPHRALYGSFTSFRDQVQGPVASCIALSPSIDGCRELTEIYVSFGASQGSRVRAIAPYHIVISNRRLISGLTFLFDNGRSVNAGYIGRPVNQTDPILSPRSLWLVFSRLGFEAVKLDTYPRQFLHSYEPACEFAVARWPSGYLKGIWLGLDAIRIVRIGLDTLEYLKFDTISWTHPYPEIPPSIYEGDIATLHELQRGSFAPVSTLCIAPANGQLIGIKVYSALGPSAGINGIGFLYDTGVEHTLGSADNASLAFFLDAVERLIKVTAYRRGPVILHLEFTTTSHRTSGRLPQLQVGSPTSLECINYAASNNGYITGLSGCFVDNRLNCLGVIATNTALISQSLWSAPHNPVAASHSESRLQEMPLGGIKNHGEHQSWLQLKRKYRSVQVSINPVTLRYRRAGQVTGLLFRSGHDRPDLLGQWTGAGDTCVLEEDEQILALEFTMCKPGLVARPGLSQVQGVTLVTNLKRVDWGPSRPRELVGKSHCQQRMIEITWDFNAIFDRLCCIRS